MLELTVKLVQVLGGLGIFLLGMIVLTEGLRALAGDAMRAALMRFTRNPVTGALTGAISTAMLQSSSATTVAAVGFVGAGLMSFSHSLGIIFGANIGTTITGWLVALIGFKLKLGTLMLPLILLGVLLRLFAKGRFAQLGFSIAGFAIIFVGIELMQQGMSELQHTFTFENLPADSMLGRLRLVLFGILFTIVTQSSSAGVAAALTALFANFINFEQAASLVVGMDIGTTATAFLATIGGTTGAKRTGVSHVIYNCFTGLMAFFLISPFVWIWQFLQFGPLVSNAEIALVAFHTTFNALGVILILPFSRQFARFIERIIPAPNTIYGDLLDNSLLEQPEIALNVAQRSIYLQYIALIRYIAIMLGDTKLGVRSDLQELQRSIELTQSYLDDINLDESQTSNWQRLISQIHALDHMQRLFERCEEQEERALTCRVATEISKQRSLLLDSIREIIDALEQQSWSEAAKSIAKSAHKIVLEEKSIRQQVMLKIAKDEVESVEANKILEATRWLSRVSLHMERITHHYKISAIDVAK